MFKNILVTVDLSEKNSWEKALPQAVELVRQSGGKLHVISVIHDYGMPLVSTFFPEGFREQALIKAKEALDALIDEFVPDEMNVEAHLAYGVIHDQVLQAIIAAKVDLVVMASHAPDQIREFLVGSEADRVVRRSPVSVLVVR